MSFPLAPKPAQYRYCTYPNNRNGVFYLGDQPIITLSSSGGATAYEVRDYYGAIVAGGSVSAGATTITPTSPAGGWKPGWYRVLLTGPVDDAVFGRSAGASSFCIIRDDPHFPRLPGANVSGGDGNESRDLIAKGVMGLGTTRLSIGSADSLNTGADSLPTVLADLVLAKTYWSAPGAPYADSARPRPLWTNFPNQTWDGFGIAATSGTNWLNIYPKTESVDGSKVFVSVVAGTIGGTTKIVVYYPNASTPVETFDNLVSNSGKVASTVNASAYIKTFDVNQETGPVLVPTPRALGTAFKQGVAQVVASLYPDVQRFEGPSNEPNLNAESAHTMRLFQAAVHAGHPSAKAIGPCPVDISNFTGWRAFFAAGGGNYCDEISFHDYNSMTNGNIAHGRAAIPAFLAILAEYGQAGKALWQTEAGAAFTAVYGVHHPRRARVKMIHTMLWEQFGVPRERNSYWYDRSHGFWNFPTWFENSDGTLSPDAPIARVMAEETWGKPYSSALSFGFYGDRIFLGSLYSAPGGASVLAIVTTSALPGASVTVTVTGTSSLTYVDAFGNETTVTVDASRRVTVPVGEVPTYLRVPAGATATVHHCNDWPPTSRLAAWASSAPASRSFINDRSAALIGNDAWPTAYPDPNGLAEAVSLVTTGNPSTATMVWERATRLDRVIVWAGAAWQYASTLVDFDVQTSNDGVTWTTRKTVTKPTPTSFMHGTDYSNVGCQRETYWDEQWIFDVKLDAPINTKMVRLLVRATSYGGEPDAAAYASGGQGDGYQRMVLMEIATLCDDNVRSQAVVLA